MRVLPTGGGNVIIGPIVDTADGKTPINTLAMINVDEAVVIKQSAATATDITGYTMVAVTNATGYYKLTLDSSSNDTVGELTIAIRDDDVCYPYSEKFRVVHNNHYNSLYVAADTDYLQVDQKQISTSTPAADALELFALTLSSGAITASTMATDSIDAAALAADALAEINAQCDAAISDAALATAANLATVDGVVDAIKLKTDNLPADPADASDIAASFAALPTATENADALMIRGATNWDDSADVYSLGAMVMCALNSSISGTVLTAKKADNTTFDTYDLTAGASADPIVGIKEA